MSMYLVGACHPVSPGLSHRVTWAVAPCQVGDASAVQSPISFGGFCAMLRHLPRYTRGIDLALRKAACNQM